jgi:hypothetical protein
MVHYTYYIGLCLLAEVYLICIMFQELDVTPFSGCHNTDLL